MRLSLLRGKKRLASFLSLITVLAVFLLLVSLLVSRPVLAAAGINQQVSFTGKIVNSNGTNIADGTYDMEFKIYQDGNNQGTGSTLKWTEDWIVGGVGGITLTSGTFQVNLGAGTDSASLDSAVNFNQSVLWLSLQIGQTTTCTVSGNFQGNCGGDGEMKPYIALTAVPQAFNAEQLGGLTSTGFIQNTSSVQSASNFHISATGAADTSFTAPSFDSQAANGVLGLGNTNAGAITIGNVTNSTVAIRTKNATAAVQIQNASGAIIFNFDTTASLASANLIANPSFETTITGSGVGVWVKKSGSETTFANNTTQFFNQLNSVKITTSAAANDGTKQQLNTTLTGNTAYNVIFYARLDIASANPMNADLQAGYSSTGASDDIPCTLNQTLVATGWVKYICSFTTPASPTSSNYFYIKQTDAFIHTFYVDAVLLQLASSADANYRDSQVQINGTIVTPIIIQNTSNSTNALLVQNAAGGQIFNVDTTDSNLINNPANPSFEVNTAGWTTVVNGGTVTIARDTSQQKYGVASLKITTTAQTAQGARYTLTSGNWAAGSYTVSFSMLNSGTAFAAIPIVKFGNGSDNACSAATPSTLPATNGWIRYAAACTFSGSTTSVAIEQNEATAHTFYIDAVQLETGGTATSYGLGAISLGAQIITPLQLKNQTNNNNALQLQDISGNVLLNVDTEGDIVGIGSTGAQSLNSTVNLANSSGNVTQTVNIGSSANTNSAVSIEAGNTGKIQIGNVNAAHTIQIGATAGSAQLISVGNATASSSLVLAAGSGNGSFTVTSGTLTLQTATSGAISITSAAASTYSTGAGNIILQPAGSGTTASVQIGAGNGGAGSTTPDLLVLDASSSASDPTGANGAMYYNVSTGTFRCFQGSAWRNCLGGGPNNQSTAAQTPTAGTDTYLAGSLIPLPVGGFRGPTGSAQDGSKITWRIVMTKTAVGTVASTFTIRVGTAGTTGDTSRCTAFSTGTASAAIDVAVVNITVYATAGGAVATLNCSATLTHTLTATTGWNTSGYVVQAYTTQTSFDSTPAGTKIGLSFNGGTSLVATIQSVDAITSNL